MADKPKPQPDDKAQSDRFIEAARELGVDESGREFERAFEQLVPEKAVSRSPGKASRP